MKKNPFLIFVAVMTLLVSGAIWFIQSPSFAGFLKGVAAKYVPADLGLEANFSELSVGLFPPAISLRNPVVTLKDRNILKLPAGSSVKAERIDLVFRPFQMLSGNIRIHQTTIVNGDVRLILNPASSAEESRRKSGAHLPGGAMSRALKVDFHWDELLQIRTESIAVQDTGVHVEWKGTGERVEFLARSLRISQWTGKGGIGYQIGLDVMQPRGSVFNGIFDSRLIESISATAHTNVLGVRLDEFSLKGVGAQLSAKGEINGNILNPKGLQAETEVTASGDLQRVLNLLNDAQKPGKRVNSELRGQAKFAGKLRTNLDRPLESLRADGTIEVANAGFGAWEAQHVLAQGAWLGSAAGGELSITKVVIDSPEKERVLASAAGKGKPGSGGKITVGAFKLNLAQPGPVAVALQLERAHLHWLAAVATKDVFGLPFRVSGPLEAVFTPGPKWNLQAKFNLGVQDFQLDNQKQEKVKALRRVLKVPRIGLEGSVLVDATGFRPHGLGGVTLSLPKSRFKVGGKVDFKTGFDLYAMGNAQLADVGQIAENDIEGEGILAVHVHGPSSRVLIDFDADVQNAAYLNLKLGQLKGRITWDDDPSHLIFSKVQVKKGRTLLDVDGRVDAGATEAIALEIGVQQGDIQDVIQVFDKLTKDLWWLPRSLNGPVNGQVQVFGGLDMNKLEVLGKLNGRNWELFGEKLDQVSVVGGYDKGRYHLSDFHALKHAGKLTGRISFDSDDDTLDWDFLSQGLTVSDLDHIARLDVPIRGKLSVESAGKGKIGTIKSSTLVQVSDVAVRGNAMPPSQLNLRSEGGRLQVKGNALGGQGTLDLDYDFTPVANSSLRLEARHLDFAPILLLLNPQTIPDPAVAGFVSGAVNLNFRTGEIERASGSIELSEYLLAKTGTRFRLAKPVSFRMSDGSFNVDALSVRGNHGEATLRLNSRRGELDGTVTGELDVSIAEFLTSSVAQATGVADLDFLIGGKLKELTLSGKATIEGVSFRVPAVETPFENVSGVFQLRQNAIHVRNLQGDLAGGNVHGEGTVALFADRMPQIDLRAQLLGNKLKVYPFQYAKVRGGLSVTGAQLPYLVAGSVVVESALSREKVFQQKHGQSLKTAQYTPPPSARRMSDYPWFKLDIDVKSEGGILIQNELFDVDIKTQMKIVNTLDAPRPLGNADLVQGRLIFKDRSFQIQSASAVFDSPTVINPRFNMTAATDLNGVKVQMYAAGRMDKWKIELTSNPVMPESEILSLLALGMTSTDARRLSTNDRSVFEQGEAASLLLHSLDFNRELESKTGLQIQLDESMNSQQGNSAFRRQAQSESNASPKIVIRKQILKNVDLSVGHTVGIGSNSQREVNAEVQVTPGLSVIGVYDNFEDAGANERQNSYGLDLKVQKRFK